MSKKNRRFINTDETVESKKENESLDKKDSENNDSKKSFWKGLGGIEKVGVFGLCLLLVVGVMGSSLGDSIINAFSGDDIKNSKTSANSKNSSNNSETSLLSRLNPFANPSPTPTPQLAKSYVYAGSRLLAVEDANATAFPPADLAIWRPSSGTWWVMGGTTGSQQTNQQWGVATDVALPGDYDGDGKTDFCVYREVSGGSSLWYVINSSDNTTSVTTFGSQALNDKPTPADFDGDGRTDLAIYRPGTTSGVWYVIESSSPNTTVSTTFGLPTDEPTPKDFDGDGKADLALWRDSNTTFYSTNSSNSLLQITVYGASGDKPVPADYDGDGKADVALYRSSNSNWYIQESSTLSNVVHQLGVSTDTVVHNDYDGDGKVDVAVWRGVESASKAGDVGKWYIRQSSDSTLRIATWGIAGDIPVPAYYRR